MPNLVAKVDEDTASRFYDITFFWKVLGSCNHCIFGHFVKTQERGPPTAQKAGRVTAGRGSVAVPSHCSKVSNTNIVLTEPRLSAEVAVASEPWSAAVGMPRARVKV